MLAGEFDPDPKARLSPWLIYASGTSLLFILLAIASMIAVNYV